MRQTVCVRTLRTVRASPSFIADALLQLQVKVAVARAIGQTVHRLGVRLRTISALPSLAAHANPGHAVPVSRALRVQTVHVFAVFALVAGKAVAASVDAVSVAVAVGNLAFIIAQVALLALPP